MQVSSTEGLFRTMKLTVVAGNPKAGSRTLDAALTVASHLLNKDRTDVDSVDVITLGSGLLGWGDPDVAKAMAKVSASDMVVFASPTFKATYSGVLKVFLDQFAGGVGLAGVVAVPLMLGAGPTHAMAPDLFLKHVLVELGAITPAPGLYLMESSYAEDNRISDYIARWGSTLVAATRKEKNSQ